MNGLPNLLGPIKRSVPGIRKAVAGPKHTPGTPFRGPSGRWFMVRPSDNRTVPARDPNAVKPTARKPAAVKPIESKLPPAKPPAPKKPKPEKPVKLTSEQKLGAATETIARIGKEGGSPETAGKLADQLGSLTVVQLKGLMKAHGVKTASGALKVKLVEALKGRFADVPKPVPEKPKPIESKLPAKPPAAERPAAVQGGIDYKQKDPDHPVAKEILADEGAAKVLQGLLKRREQFEASEAGKALGEYRQVGGQQAENAAYNKLMRASGKAFSSAQREWFSVKDLGDKVKPILTKLRAEEREAFLDSMRAENRMELKYTWDGREPPTAEQKKGMEDGLRFVNRITEGAGVKVNLFFAAAKDGRACYRNALKSVDVGDGYTPNIVAHEMGHFVEYNKEGVRERVQAFLKYRVGDEQGTDIGTLKYGEGMKGEMGRKDNFDRYFGEVAAHYVGKEYPGGATEVLSMGIQALYEDPVGFMQADPEYAQFVVSVLRMQPKDYDLRLEDIE